MMDRFRNWRKNLMLGILGVVGLAVLIGSTAGSPVGNVLESQASIAQRNGTSDEVLSSGKVVSAPVTRDPDIQRTVADADKSSGPSPSASVYSSSQVQPTAQTAPQPMTGVPARPSNPATSSSADFGDSSQSDPEPESQLRGDSSEEPVAAPTQIAAAMDEPPTIQPELKMQPPSISKEQKDPLEADAPSIKAQQESGENLNGTEYTWEDGGRTLTVILQEDLTVSEGESVKGAMADAPSGSIVRSEDSASARSDQKDKQNSLPVFKSQSGALMTLPGGILLVLDSALSVDDVKSFFAKNSIKQDKVEPLGFVDNGYFIQTEPGFPSLNLANDLAGKEGVLISSPNWWTEVSYK